MSHFILFIDDVGAEFTKARATRKEVIGVYEWKPIKLVPHDIRPVEVIAESGAAKRAAGGFLLLGPVGAAVGVLLGKGPKVLFELVMADGSTRRGIIDQDGFPALRKKIVAIQTYKPGQLRKQLAALLTFVVCIALGPVGWVLLVVIIAVVAGRDRARRRLEANTSRQDKLSSSALS
jgi:hypothetical protein